MPTIRQSELPRPKSWDEFEDIVWDLYTRLWEDPTAQRYGRSGQAQQGVDVYGRPARLGGGYAGIQCKRYEAGRLTRARIEAEIAKAETFTPPLAEYLIATTEPRDAPLQAMIREVNQEREAAAEFPVSIIFWDDLCSHLTAPANQDLLQKHYGDWLGRGFGLHLGAPFQAPPLPAHFVPRPEVSDAVKERLLAEEGTAPGVLVVGAIQGLGGIGKSVLAAALAHDPDVQARFPDGVLWVTLGQRPELHSLLGDWIVNGLRDYSYRPTTVEAASTYLRTLLLDKAALLVVDDVWEAEHARPFLVGSARCCVLITTRRADVADEVGAGLHQMDVMTPAQSLALLEARLGRSLGGEERQDAQRLARLVGHLPLALELAAVRVGRGATWAGLCAALEGEVARLEALDGARRRRKRATRLEACFTLSLDALRADDAEAWEAFALLGVLPEDVTIAAPMAAALWDVDRAEAGELLELLWNEALLLPGLPVRVGEEEVPGYRLHDLLHDLARGLLTGDPPGGLGRSLREAHSAFLECYRARTRSGLWHTLPDDGYIHEHLTWHLEQAGWEEEVHVLLAEETPEGRNGWFEARDRLGQTAGFLADVSRAWRLAEEQVSSPQSEPAGESHRLHAPGLQCRYALLLASLNSLAGNIPPELLVALVERDGWTPAQGLAYARQVPEPRRRVEVLAGLAPLLTEGQREEALSEGLAVARTIENARDRAEALVALAPHLTEELLIEGLAAARAIEYEGRGAHVLAALAPQLTGGLREEVLAEGLAMVRAIKDDWAHAKRRGMLAMEYEELRAKALAALAPQLTGELLIEGLAVAQAIRDERERAEALAALAPQLTGELLGEGLAAAQAMEHEELRAHVLAALVPQLTGKWPAVGLASARAIGDEGARVRALAALAPQLSGGLREEALAEGLAAAQAIWNERWRAEALAALALQLSGGLREEVLGEGLAVARAIRDEGERAEALAALAPQLTGRLREEALAEGLAVARAISDEGERAEALAALAPQLTGEWLGEGLAAVRAIGDEGARARALAMLAPQLTGEWLAEGLAAVWTIEDEWQRLRALEALVPQLTGKLLAEGLAAARAIGYEGARTRALAALAPQLTGRHREEALAEGLAAARAIGDEGARARALTMLASQLMGDLLVQALAAAQGIRNRRYRAQALAGLALHLTGRQREDVLAEGLVVARAIEYAGERADALAGLAPHLTGRQREDVLAEGLAAVRAIENKWWRARVLAALAPQLREGQREEVLTEGLAAARAIWNERWRAHALAALAPQLAGALRGEVLAEGLAAAQAIEYEKPRAEALAALAPQLTGKLLSEGLAAAQAIGDEEDRACALAALAPQLGTLPFTAFYPLWRETLHYSATRSRRDLLSDLGALVSVIAALGGEEAVAETARAIQDVGRWWP